jgi:hypothetical protein
MPRAAIQNVRSVAYLLATLFINELLQMLVFVLQLCGGEDAS